MEENKEKKIDTDEIKNETVNTVKEVKETIKNVDVKKDAIETKGFIKEMFTNPLEKIKNIVDDNSNKFFKHAIILIIVWVAAILLKEVFTAYAWKYGVFKQILRIIKSIIAPVLGIITMSIIIMVLNKQNKKALTNIVSAVTAAEIPLVIAAVVSLLTIISSSISAFTVPFYKFCSIVSILFMYFTAKNIFAESENSKFIKKFIIIEAIYYVAYFVFTFLGIYI